MKLTNVKIEAVTFDNEQASINDNVHINLKTDIGVLRVYVNKDNQIINFLALSQGKWFTLSLDEVVEKK